MQTEAAVEIESEDIAEELIDSGDKIDLQPPPFSEVQDGPEYENTSVTIELNNAQRIKGKLTQFDTVAEVISLLEPRASLPTDVDL
jgi:hypothetical protein